MSPVDLNRDAALEDADQRVLHFYLYLYLLSISVVFAIEQYLRSRKARALASGMPLALAGRGVVTEEEYAKTQAYCTEKNIFGTVKDCYSYALALLSVLRLDPLTWDTAVSLSPWPGNLYASILVYLLISTALSFVLNLPFQIYFNFVLEEAHGFNKFTPAKFAGDKLKMEGVSLLIGGIFSTGLVFVLNAAPSNAWLYLWAFVSGLVVVLNIAYPLFIAPCFNTFKALGSSEIKKGIDELIEQTGLNCKKVFEVDGSKQSSHSNAYVNGMCATKQIVIYDTLINDLDSNIDEIKSVVGHEIGHSIMNHTYVLLGLTLANLFVMFFSFGYFEGTDAVVLSFGFSESNSFLRIQCFMAVYGAVIQPVFGVFMNGVTRKLEFQADAYSVKLGMDIREALIKISKKNKGDLNPDWMHSLYHLSHPPLLERLDAVSLALKAE